MKFYCFLIFFDNFGGVGAPDWGPTHLGSRILKAVQIFLRYNCIVYKPFPTEGYPHSLKGHKQRFLPGQSYLQNIFDQHNHDIFFFV